jgi:hypothetical protein
MPKGSLFGHTSPAAIPFKADDLVRIGFWLNTRIFSFLLRSVNQSVDCQEGYVQKLPLPDVLKSEEMLPFVTACSILRREINRSEIHEWLFDFSMLDGKSCHDRFATEAVYAALDGQRNIVAAAALSLGSSEMALVADDVGTEAGRYAALLGWDAVPALPVGLAEIPSEALGFLSRHERRALGDAELVQLLRRLRQLYEAGPGGRSADDDSDAGPEENEDDEEASAVGARLPIPAETFIEELSQRLEVHPISIYWLLKQGIERDAWRCPPEERRLTEDRFTVLVLRLLGHRWPKQLETGDPLPAWTDQDGVIPLTSGGGETPLIERVRARLAEDFPGSSVAELKRDFEEVVGVLLEEWVGGPFFERHIGQFKKRPIAWQIETNIRGQMADGRKRKQAKKPVFACLIYYHRLDEDLLPKIRTQYVGPLRRGYEVELRTLERLVNATSEQQGRKLVLELWAEELKAFDQKLEMVSSTGFGPQTMRPALRQYGIEDALLSLMAGWLRRLEDQIGKQKAESRNDGSPLSDWLAAADGTGLHEDLAKWVDDAFKRLDYFCATVGPKAPKETEFLTDPTSKDLAPLVCASPAKTVERVLDLACDRWWQRFVEIVLDPLKRELKRKKAELDEVKEQLELDEVKRDSARHLELADRQEDLKREVKRLKEEIEEKTDKGKELRSEIEAWACPESATWEDWLGTQPLFDGVASLDGKRKPPVTIAEFVAQESAYAPDINDGVRVNIAPLQKTGLLHSDVLDFKDADKALADRAEWRADERRWVREGKLPRPGWWAAEGMKAEV